MDDMNDRWEAEASKVEPSNVSHGKEDVEEQEFTAWEEQDLDRLQKYITGWMAKQNKYANIRVICNQAHEDEVEVANVVQEHLREVWGSFVNEKKLYQILQR